VPWPSATEVAEQRAAARGEAPSRLATEEELSESGPAATHPTSKKRKRKRRH